MNIKQEFPYTSSNVAYLDSASSTQKPQAVLDAITSFYKTRYANVHRGLYPLAVAATEDYESARKTVAEFIGAAPEEIVFTGGTTDSMNLLASTFPLKQDDIVICSQLDHHSTLVPWQQAARRAGATFKLLPIDEHAVINHQQAVDIISQGCTVLAITHLSNMTGQLMNVELLARAAHEQGGHIFIDGAQAAAHIPIDVKDIPADAYCFSSHKIYGPTGVGALYLPKHIAKMLSPYRYGGEMVDIVHEQSTTFQNSPHKFEAGTPPIVQAVGMAAAIKWISMRSEKERDEKEALTTMCADALAKLPYVKLTGSADLKRRGVISFTVSGVHPHDVSQFLGDAGVCIRAGHHCCQIAHDKLGLSATCRVSFGFNNDKADVQKFLSELQKCKEAFDV